MLGRVALVAMLLLLGAACVGEGSQVTVGPPAVDGERGGSDGGGAGTTDGGLGDCASILKTYLSLASNAVRGKDAAAAAEKTLQGIADSFPPALQQDLAVVAAAFGDIASKGLVQGSRSLRTHEFLEANKNILGYLRHDCLPG